MLVSYSNEEVPQNIRKFIKELYPAMFNENMIFLCIFYDVFSILIFS